jgi:site-specific DNA recombinase
MSDVFRLYMMTTAILYIRVSTDEQAVKGYSKRNQAERLKKYCIDNNIEVLQTIFEDHSAKSFKRPEWSKLMQILHQHKMARPKFLLFTRWDRFSRNTADAYYMITQLQKWKVEPQAIDQPLNMAIPENKVLLAIYIVTSEVENDRRSLNVKQGIHKAKQEGRWIGRAPLGFVNSYSTSGRMSIIPHDPEAFLIKKAFLRITEQNQSIRMHYKQSIDDGLQCSLNAFWHIIRNPVYCGKIKIPSVEDKAEYEVKGIHDLIVTEELFDQVQAILNGKRKHIQSSLHVDELLPFRGFLYCPNCNRKLSGSGSRGRTKRYYYYHCFSPCSYRIRADEVHEVFGTMLKSLKADKEYDKLYKFILQDTFQELVHKHVVDEAYISAAVNKLITRTSTAKVLLTNGGIDSEDYLAIKQDCEQRINALGSELHNAYAITLKYEQDLNTGRKQFSELLDLYEHSDLVLKRQLIGLLLTEKTIFNGLDFYSNLNLAAQVVYRVTNFEPRQYPDAGKDNEGAILSEQDNRLCLQIKGVERRRGYPINETFSLQILQFMKGFAKAYTEGLNRNVSHSMAIF